MLYVPASRLHDIHVGVTSHHPSSVSPAADNYALCGTHVAVVAPGKTATVFCVTANVVGRYVIIQIPGNDQLLTLCDVEVLGEFYGKLNVI